MSLIQLDFKATKHFLGIIPVPSNYCINMYIEKHEIESDSLYFGGIDRNESRTMIFRLKNFHDPEKNCLKAAKSRFFTSLDASHEILKEFFNDLHDTHFGNPLKNLDNERFRYINYGRLPQDDLSKMTSLFLT